MPTEEVHLRPAVRGDLAAVADLHVRVRRASTPAMPPLVGGPEERPRRTCRGWDLDTHELWLAETDVLVGYAMVHEQWLHSLYVDPAVQGQGIGSMLLDLAKVLRPTGFCLYVFESNTPARLFYARQGLVELERTDGSTNAEHAPDIRMAWPGPDPVAFYRGLIDEVDEQLGDLLGQRAALTAAVQPHKRHPGPRPRARARDRRGDGRPGARRSARSGWPGSCTRSSPRASTPPAERGSRDCRCVLPSWLRPFP